MAGMSNADKTYMTHMTACQKDCIATAETYLAASPADRNANLTDMATMVIKSAKMDMAKMAKMMPPMSR